MAKKHVKVGIIGGGAAGITAAISAAQVGGIVTILEKNPRIGKKILVTGNGRCNYTNLDMNIGHFHGQNNKFAFSALSYFDNIKTIDFFEKLGVRHKTEIDNKVIPYSDQASSVLDALRFRLDELGVNTITDSEVIEIKKKDEQFTTILKGGASYTFDKLIVCTGGKAMPASGSDGGGYKLARSFGHKIIEPFPALVQLKLSSKYLSHIQGIKFDGKAEVIHNKKSAGTAMGEILFTSYGISGPPIFALSRKASEILSKDENSYIKVTIASDFTREELEEYVGERVKRLKNRPLELSLAGFINKKLGPVLLKEVGITDLNRKIGSLTNSEINKVIDILQDWRFEIIGTNSWPAAQTTAGGIDVSEINAQTMESKLAKGLYFAGEVIDIDGDCGGYNLQWAWSSGFLAGEKAVEA